MDKARILDRFSIFSFGSGRGIGTLLTPETDDEVFRRLADLAKGAVLSLEEFNQLLLLAHEASVTRDFFDYYWLTRPLHTYELTHIDGYDEVWFASEKPRGIESIDHLRWGLFRLYIDGLLYFGNVRTAFRKLRTMRESELSEFFQGHRFDTDALAMRGPALPLKDIAKHHRYLTSEMACACYATTRDNVPELKKALTESWVIHSRSGGARARVRHILTEEVVKAQLAESHARVMLSAQDILDEFVESEADMEIKYERIAQTYAEVRCNSLRNTDLYLSMVNDMDVYVATSMRTCEDFIDMATFCEDIFSDQRLKNLKLRYFDPTRSAAAGHEDKGLTECLMVKCAKALVYCAGEKESYGKDAEAAMALSLGKPVIFYCKHAHKKSFYRDVHPLSRLIEFHTGVAVGAIITDSQEQVSELLVRLLENRMQYRLEQQPQGSGYLRLVESMTGSVVRLQTNCNLLAETFWNHYHNR